MIDPTFIFIVLCFLAITFVWIKNAKATKPTIQERGSWTLRAVAILIIIAVFVVMQESKTFLPFLRDPLWSQALWVLILADLVTALGVFVMIWARRTLGSNWSANIVLKEDHKLITTGPYAYVRHPIYSGIVLLVLGLTIYFASWTGVILFILFFAGAYLKGYREEELLTEYFQEEYPAYKARVKALIPFIL